MTHESSPDTPLYVEDILAFTQSPEELAAQMTESELYDYSAAASKELETDLNQLEVLSSQLEAIRQRIRGNQLKLATSQQAIRLAREKGLE